VLFGESGPELERLFRDAGLVTTARADTLDAAVATAAGLARDARQAREARGNGDAHATATVLLSPAAASFDMFDDYEARGRAFKAAVARLVEDRR
jgi:UDP-N-acetylmuramoylalanine--D-glutamate ligase